MNELLMKDIILYPNPATNRLFIELSTPATNAELTIYNLLGEKIFSSVFSGQKTEINIGFLSSGIYMIGIVAENGRSKKIIIKQ